MTILRTGLLTQPCLLKTSAGELLFRALHLLQAVAKFEMTDSPPPLCAST